MAAPAAVDPYRARRKTYRGISAGVTLICVGGVLLANTLGVVGWGVWIELLKLWPLILISMGVRRLFVSTQLHPLSLLGPLLVAGAVVWVAADYQPEEGITEASMASARSVDLECPGPDGGEAVRLNLDFAAGDLMVVGGSDPEAQPAVHASRSTAAVQGPTELDGMSGIHGTLRYVGREPRSSCFDSGTLRLRPYAWNREVHIIWPFGADWRNRWEARLATGSPLDVDLRLAASTADLDLSAFTLSRLEMDAAASRIVLQLGRPATRVPIRIHGAVTDLRLIVAEGTCFTVVRDKTLSFLDADDGVDTEKGSRRLTARACEAGPADGPRYEIRYELPLSSVTIETRGPSSPPSPAS